MFLGIAALTPIALNGVVLFMVAHGLMTALLFAMGGAVSRQTGTREIRGIGGLGRVLPFTAVLMAMGALASAGVPGFANFVSELMIFIGSWQSGGFVLKLATVAAVWGLVITATYLLRALRDTFYGPLPERFAAKKEEVGIALKFASIALIAALLLLGFQPRLLTDGIRTAVAELPMIGKIKNETSSDWKVFVPPQKSEVGKPVEVAGGSR
jgi:NADH-quinone oxidoreductase subunit M